MRARGWRPNRCSLRVLHDHYDDLAHHYGRSGNTPKAVNYLQLAAQQAMNRSAYVEAEGQLVAALELLRTLPGDPERARTELALLVSQARCRTYIGSSSATVEKILKRALRSLRKGWRRRQPFRNCALARVRISAPRRQRAENRARSLRNFRESRYRAADPELVARAWCELAVASTFDGNFIAALEEFDWVSKLPVGTTPFEAISFCTTNSWALWFLGYPERAKATNRKLLALGREVTASIW